MKTRDEIDPWLFRPDLARWFSRCERTIAEWERRGWLPPGQLMPNGRRAWQQSLIRRFVASNGGSRRLTVETKP